ncbi:MAG: T9SS type A sorting domain-containing protein [Ignavibacteria bacterium]
MKNLLIMFLMLGFTGFSFFYTDLPKENIFSISNDVTFDSAYLDANNIRAGIINDGSFHRPSPHEFNDFIWPKDSNRRNIFSSGLWLAGKVNDSVRGEITYNYGECYPGFVDFASQVPMGKDDPAFRIYKVSPLFPDGGTGFDNWDLWPVDQGAPWIDNNGNGNYDPPIDIPLMKGDQNLFCAFTDGYPESHNNYAGGGLPLNADIHLYCYAKINSTCTDMNFMEWKIINKMNTPWDSARIGVWSDIDIPDAGSNMMGSDENLNMGYCYTGGPIEPYNLPRALGFLIYGVNQRSGILMDFANDPRKHFYEPNNIKEAYNQLNGLMKDGTAWINPVNNQVTKYVYNGDPVNGSGWNCVSRLDQRILIGSDLGTVLPLDTIKFKVAVFITPGSTHLEAVANLKECAANLVSITKQNSLLPESFKLFQNYPNPFNPNTVINYELNSANNVLLKIFDATGKEVSTLVNSRQNAGEYSVRFDGSNLPSGIYFYKIIVGKNVASKKMMLIK